MADTRAMSPAIDFLRRTAPSYRPAEPRAAAPCPARDHRARAFRIDGEDGARERRDVLTRPGSSTARARAASEHPTLSELRDDDAALTRWWSAADVARVADETAPATRDLQPRAPRLALAILLALIGLLVPICAPLGWTFARDELRAIAAGIAQPRHRRALQALYIWGELITFLATGFAIGHVVGLVVR
jgi:hypothetical protein